MTLMELLVSVMILALVGSFAALTYVTAYEKVRGQNAVAMVRMLHAAERVYRMDWNNPTSLAYPCTSNLITERYIECPNQGNNDLRAFDYNVSILGGGSFGVTATRNRGRYSGRTIILTQAPDGTVPPYSWSGNWSWLPPN